MSINCEIVGQIEQPLATGDEVQPTFDISTWLGTDTIASVAYSAVDEAGEDVTATVLTLANHDNTNTVIKPWIKGGATNNKQYTIKMVATTTSTAEKKAFYIKYSVRNIGE